MERPTGRTTLTRSARSGGLWCAVGALRFGHPGVAGGPGRVVPAAGGVIRVVGPEALPAGGVVKFRSQLNVHLVKKACLSPVGVKNTPSPEPRKRSVVQPMSCPPFHWGNLCGIRFRQRVSHRTPKVQLPKESNDVNEQIGQLWSGVTRRGDQEVCVLGYA